MRDVPSAAARRAVGRALGVSFVAGLSTTVASANAATVLGSVAAAPSVALGFATLAKWCAVGFLAGTAATASVAVPMVAYRASNRTQAPPAAPSLGTLPNPPSPGAAPQPASVEAPRTPAPPSPRPRLVAGIPGESVAKDVAPSPSEPAAPSRSEFAETPSLSREIALLERVRAKLGAGDARGALAELDRIEPDVEALAMEAELLRVEALLASGERKRAEALASELERRHPHGPLGFRLKRLLGGQ
jgi:hypothetical protein